MRYSTEEIYKALKKTVIGQDVYLKTLATAAWLHMQRIHIKDRTQERLQKSNVLVIGTTGSGKTLAVSELAKILDVTLVIENACDFTGTGWKGRDAVDMIKDAYEACGRNADKTESCIIFIDEIDKVVLREGGTCENTFNVINPLLKLIEGTRVVVENRQIDTSHVMFICAGAFDGLEAIISNRRRGVSQLGFSGTVISKKVEDNLFAYVTKADLIKYGVNSQFAGRFDILVSLKTLEINELKEILLSSKASCIHTMNTLLQKSVGVGVTIDEDCAEAIARKAIKEKTGARGLSARLYEMIQERLFELGAGHISGQIKLTMVDEHPTAILVKESFVEIAEENQNCFITAKNNLKSVERYVDRLLGTPKATEIYCSMRELRAIHIFVSSVVLYLLSECNQDDQTISSIIRLMQIIDIYEVLVFEIKEDSLPLILYKKAKGLNITSRAVRFAISALEEFNNTSKFFLQKRK